MEAGFAHLHGVHSALVNRQLTEVSAAPKSLLVGKGLRRISTDLNGLYEAKQNKQSVSGHTLQNMTSVLLC